MTITEFLTARLDEDEAAARAAATTAERIHERTGRRDPRATRAWTEHGVMGPHVALSPARVLAEVEAKRRIVEWFSDRQMIFTGGMGDDRTDPTNYTPGPLVHEADTPVLRMLALPHADHPDYDEAWRP
ncbi:DUF6221 family protein [Isoptericola aurantiacus]|uniref:DUF6221 family protein n=1 Tax=Isoptericola aurantiacus TaxID=3377839 RepID=UPI00383B7425